jgi:hypothetical protein
VELRQDCSIWRPREPRVTLPPAPLSPQDDGVLIRAQLVLLPTTPGAVPALGPPTLDDDSYGLQLF